LQALGYVEQIAYAVIEIPEFTVTVQPVAGVVAVPPTGAEVLISLLLPCVPMSKPPPVAFG
jgi:hypothetical protein